MTLLSGRTVSLLRLARDLLAVSKPNVAIAANHIRMLNNPRFAHGERVAYYSHHHGPTSRPETPTESTAKDSAWPASFIINVQLPSHSSHWETCMKSHTTTMTQELSPHRHLTQLKTCGILSTFDHAARGSLMAMTSAMLPIGTNASNRQVRFTGRRNWATLLA